jgi:outer membrane immunogenic protein
MDRKILRFRGRASMIKELTRAGAAVASILVLTASASAQPAPRALFNWSGFYLGAQADYSRGRGDVESSYTLNPALFTTPIDLDGWGGGLRAGYDTRSGNWIAGEVGDLSLTNFDGEGFVGPFIPVGGGLAGGSFHDVSQKVSAFGTLRARAGVLMTEQVLGFVSGGLAFGRLNLDSHTFHGPSITNFVASETKWRSGWTIGGGAEWSAGQGWSVVAEYLYYDLGKTSLAADSTPPGAGQFANRWRSDGHLFRFGVNYRFGG